MVKRDTRSVVNCRNQHCNSIDGQVPPVDHTKLICTVALRVYPLAAHRSFFVGARKLAQKYTSLPASRQVVYANSSLTALASYLHDLQLLEELAAAVRRRRPPTLWRTHSSRWLHASQGECASLPQLFWQTGALVVACGMLASMPSNRPCSWPTIPYRFSRTRSTIMCASRETDRLATRRARGRGLVFP